MARYHTSLLTALLAPTFLSLVGCGFLVKSSYPEEQATVEEVSVNEAVDIFIDPLGVPHIFAETMDDGAFAIGFMHARDRRFQMELIRLASQGRLTEMLGEDLLQVDRRLRILTYHLDEALAALPEIDRKRMTTYCDGVNEGTANTPRPLEFKLLKYAPEPWTPKDVLAIGRLQAWDLSVDAGREASRHHILGLANEEAAEWLMTPSSHLGQSILDPESVKAQRPDLGSLPPPPKGFPLIQPSADRVVEAGEIKGSLKLNTNSDDLIEEALKWAESLEDTHGGSNAWAISSEKSAGQGATLSGDPHLSLGWPIVFHEMHIQTKNMDVSGATFPGLPMVVIGRTPYVGWTLTTSYADVQDLYSLTVDKEDPTRYKLDGKWVAFDPWAQSFKIGDETITETYRVSVFGPVYNPGREDKLRPGFTYALSWPGFEASPLPITQTFDSIYTSQSVDDVVDAIRTLPIPSQNWTFATEDGHIAYVLGGKLPKRAASPLPQDGSKSENQWTEFVSEAERPVVIDPPEGYIIASNQPISSDATLYNSYGSGSYRATSIASHLSTSNNWSTQNLRGLQVDLFNAEAAHLVPTILEILNAYDASVLEDHRYARFQKLVGLLAKWDFRMTQDSPAPLIYESLRGHTMSALFTPWIGEGEPYSDFAKFRLSEAPYYHALLDEAGKRYWDDPNTEAVETQMERMALALLATEAELSLRFGGDIEKWAWGSAHQLELEHPFAGKKILEPIFGLEPVPLPGGRHTIYALDHHGILGDFKVKTGPAIRQVVAPGTEAGFVLAGGNAGQPHHPFALNQLESWSQGEQHVAGGDRAVVEASAVGHIGLTPKGK